MIDRSFTDAYRLWRDDEAPVKLRTVASIRDAVEVITFEVRMHASIKIAAEVSFIIVW